MDTAGAALTRFILRDRLGPIINARPLFSRHRTAPASGWCALSLLKNISFASLLSYFYSGSDSIAVAVTFVQLYIPLTFVS